MTAKMMQTRRRVQTSLKKLLEKSPVVGGIVGLADGTIAVPRTENHIWVRIEGARYSIYNNRVAHLAGVPVLVGYEDYNPDFLQVLAYDYHAAPTALFPPEVPPHAWTHLFYGGQDPVFIYLRAFLPLCPGITGDFEVTVWPGMYPTEEDGWIWIESTPVDLSSYIPGVIGFRYVLIYLDADGVVLVAQSSIEPEVGLEDIPGLPENCFAICAVRLYKYQSYISDTATDSDLIDLRFPQSVSGGHTHIYPEINLALGELTDVELTLLADQDVIRYDVATNLWKNTDIAEVIAESTVGADHIHGTFETYGDGTKRDFILPNLYNPLSTEIFINGLRQRFLIEWDELNEDTVRFAVAPEQADLVTINFIIELSDVIF